MLTKLYVTFVMLTKLYVTFGDSKSEGDKLQELLLSWNNAVMHKSVQRVSKLPKVTYSLVSITKSHI
jgi:hypothetical protein